MKRLVLIAGLMMITGGAVLAQGCSVCTKTAAGLDNKSAKGLNRGILYLALLPAGIMGTVGFFWWKGRK
ncbi:MAG: hypothetical protein KF744_12510 [Taibaiella sp.]|nr:hypothetical protein [Taibaiella sp.]